MICLDDTAHLGMTGEDAGRIEGASLQRAVPDGKIDVDVAYVDSMIARVADELGRLVKSHRLRIQDRGAEHVGIEGLEPA